MESLYYSPEAFGLKIVDVLDEADLSYAFKKLIVWQSVKTGRLFYGTDSGCSCPSPFDQVEWESEDNNDLEEIVPQTFSDFEREVNRFPVSHADRSSIIRKVKQELSNDRKESASREEVTHEEDCA